MQTKVILFIALLMGLLFISGLSAEAASIYCVGPRATGNGSGSDWNNQASWSSFTPVRGNTYYVASGSYAGRDFSTADSGSTLITITKATASVHGTDVGWSSTYGTGQAIFAGSGVSFSSDYWVFDGAIGNGSSSGGSDPSSYGFYFTPPLSGSTIRPVVYNGSYVQIRHTAVTCPGPSGDIQQFGFSGQGAYVTADYTYANNCQVSHWNQGSDNVISNSYMGTYWSSSSNHGVHVEQVLRPVFFNNVITSCPIQCHEPGGGSTTNVNNGVFYNNVFVNITGTNGVFKGTSSGAYINCVFYGNTYINGNGPMLYQNNAGLGYGSGNVMINNVLYKATLYNQAGGGPISSSYDAFFDSGSSSETGAQIGTGDPFVDYVNGNYNLIVDTQPGYPLPAPYNVDMKGIARGANGVWDRGALQLTGTNSALATPSPPLNLQVQ